MGKDQRRKEAESKWENPGEQKKTGGNRGKGEHTKWDQPLEWIKRMAIRRSESTPEICKRPIGGEKFVGRGRGGSCITRPTKCGKTDKKRGTRKKQGKNKRGGGTRGNRREEIHPNAKKKNLQTEKGKMKQPADNTDLLKKEKVIAEGGDNTRKKKDGSQDSIGKWENDALKRGSPHREKNERREDVQRVRGANGESAETKVGGGKKKDRSGRREVSITWRGGRNRWPLKRGSQKIVGTQKEESPWGKGKNLENLS